MILPNNRDRLRVFATAVFLALTILTSYAQPDDTAINSRGDVTAKGINEKVVPKRYARRNPRGGEPAFINLPRVAALVEAPRDYALVTEVIPEKAKVKPGNKFLLSVGLSRRSRVEFAVQCTMSAILEGGVLGSPVNVGPLTVPRNKDEATLRVTVPATLTPGMYLIRVSQLGTVSEFAVIRVAPIGEQDGRSVMPAYTPISRVTPLPVNESSIFDTETVSSSAETEEPSLTVKSGQAYQIEVKTRKISEQSAAQSIVVFQLVNDKNGDLIDFWEERTGLSRDSRITEYSRFATVGGEAPTGATDPDIIPEGTYTLLARRKVGNARRDYVVATIAVAGTIAPTPTPPPPVP